MTKAKAIEMARRMRGTLCIFAALVLVLGTTRPAQATWRSVDAQNAWNAFVYQFTYLEPDGYSRVIRVSQGTGAVEDFWRFAEMIEVAEDAYYENPTTTNQNYVQGLCDGFVYLHSDNWSGDHFNDDLNVATIAFARAFNITGTTRWKTDAQNNYATVWNRAQAGDGGLCQNKDSGCYENSSANWTFVIAAMLLNKIDPNGTGYKSQGDGVYNWAVANLYQVGTGQVYDSKGHNFGNDQDSGYAIGAMNEEGDTTGMIGDAAHWLFTGMGSSYYDGQAAGYNVLHDYGQGNLNDSGFNGIAMRWLGIAIGHGTIDALPEQANIERGMGQSRWGDYAGLERLD